MSDDLPVQDVEDVTAERPAGSTAVVPGEPVYSDMQCPLLVADSEKRGTVVERHVDTDGKPAGETVHRRPAQRLQKPVKCPSCGIMVERIQLVSVGGDDPDCAIAINARAKAVRNAAEAVALQPKPALDIAATRDALRPGGNA
jgi:hypothetical protein